MWDGRGSSYKRYKRCNACDALAEVMTKVGCCWSFGGLLDEAQAHLDDPWEAPDAKPEHVGMIAGALFRVNELRAEIGPPMLWQTMPRGPVRARRIEWDDVS